MRAMAQFDTEWMVTTGRILTIWPRVLADIPSYQPRANATKFTDVNFRYLLALETKLARSQRIGHLDESNDRLPGFGLPNRNHTCKNSWP